MSRHQTDPLRPLTPDERIALTRLSRSLSAPAAQVERARALLAIAEGASYTAAAHQVGRRHTETLSAWVSRFNRDGLAAVRPGHGGGARVRSGADAQQRILAATHPGRMGANPAARAGRHGHLVLVPAAESLASGSGWTA
jgi:transposase-like protein